MSLLFMIALTCAPLADESHDPGSFVGEWTAPTAFWEAPVRPMGGPWVDVDEQGIRHVTYTAYGVCSNTLCGVFYQNSRDGIGWSHPVMVPHSEDVYLYCKPAVATVGGRAYIAWFGNLGLAVTWTDDGGKTFASIVNPGSSFTVAMYWDVEIDRFGALHFVWTSDGNLYYLRSLPWLPPGDLPRGQAPGQQVVPGTNPSGPVFLPEQRLAAEDGKVEFDPSVGIDDQGFVSIAYVAWVSPDLRIAYTRAYQGLNFPPSIDLGSALILRLVVSPEGPVTIIFSAYDPRLKLFSLVSTDGGAHFAGPYRQTTQPGGLYAIGKCSHAAPNGVIRAVWFQWWPGGKGAINHPTYVESHDYGVTFPRRDFIYDNRDDPAISEPYMAVAPDGVKCLTDSAYRYCQCR